MLIALYSVGFACQLVGGGLIVWEIADDIRAARTIKERGDAPDVPTEIRVEESGFVGTISGLGVEPLIKSAYESDSFRDFIANRLMRGMGRRIVGVVLLGLGAVAGFVANLIAL